MQSQLQDPEVEDYQRSLSEAEVSGWELADEDPMANVAAVLAEIAAPKPEPLKLTRQSARRLVIQRLNAEMRMGGIPRAERRRLIFWRGQHGKRAYPISDMARNLLYAFETAQ